MVASLTAAVLAFALFLGDRSGAYGASTGEVLGWCLATLASTGVGLLLATRRRENPIGWLLLTNGLVIAAMGLAEAYADYAVLAHPGALPGAAWGVLVSERAWPLLFAAITAIAWIFPDGRLPSARWRRYVCVDDATRLANVEVLPDEKGKTAAAFLQRATAWLSSMGVAAFPTTALVIAPKCMPRLAQSSECATSSPAPTGPARTARPRDSSRRLPTAGPMEQSTALRQSAPPPYPAGLTTTTSGDDTAPLAINRLRLGLPSWNNVLSNYN